MKKSEYTIGELASTVSAQKPITRKEEGETNVLPGNESEETATAGELENLNSYEPTQKIDCEAAAVKDSFEKKKKRRNYIEFRPDYSEA